MKALVLREFGHLQVTEHPDAAPGPAEVLIRVAFTGICGSDLHGYTGENGRRSPGQIMGHECSGRVVSLGAELSSRGLTVGQAVTINPVFIPAKDRAVYEGREQHHPNKTVFGVAPELDAAFAEMVAVPAENVVPLDDHMPLAHGALIEPLAVAVHAVRRIQITPDQRVLVLGGGPIGQSTVLALRMAGVEHIIVSEIDGARRELLTALGAHAVDPREHDVADHLTERWGQLADAAIDCVGVSPTLNSALSATAMGADICLVGMGAQSLDLSAFAISTGERSIVGSFTYSAQDFSDAARWVADHGDLAQTLISRVVTIDQGDETFAALAQGDGTPGKVLIQMDEGETA